MEKNYNVDDILEEIKRRKSQERGGAPGAAPPRAARPSSPAHRPPPQESPPPQPKQPEGGGFQFGPGDSTPETETPAPRQDPPRARPPKRTRTPQIPPSEEPGGSPLDFDAPVTSITDRAKMRRGTRPPGTRPARAGLDFTPPEDPAADSGLSFVPPAEEPPANVRKLDFQSRAERPHPEKKQRSGFQFSSDEPVGADLHFSRHNDEHATQVLDFQPVRGGATGTFRFPGAVDATAEHTRVLPKFDRSREFKLEEVQKFDFGAVAEGYDDYYYEDDEDDDIIPSTPPLDLGEYNSAADRGSVARDIARVRTWLNIRCVLTAVIAAILFYITLAGREPLPLPKLIFPEIDMRMYMLSIVVLSVLTALVNSSTVGGGLISLFKMRAGSDTLVSLALLACIAQGVAGVVKPDSLDPSELGIYASVAAIAMFFNALGKLGMIGRIRKNFSIISSDRDKHAVLPVQSDEIARAFVPGTERRPTIVCSAKSNFFTDFLALSYADKYDVGVYRIIAPLCLLCAVVICIFTYIFTKSSSIAIAALTAILCVAATFSSTFIENVPLGKLTKKLAPQGGMVSGTKAVEDYCDTQAMILRESDLFPEGHITLHGIKAYSHGRIDEAILDAASVICAVDSALSPVFLSMIGGNRKLLQKCDNIVYENGMGISAWVNQRRILIGNRTLMQNHGVTLPDDDYKQNYAEENGETLYLSNSGEVSAQFVVSYHIDEDLATALDHMAVRSKQLIIHTVDPNITPHKIWSLYGYPEELIDILPAEMHTIYNYAAAPRDTAPAEIVYTGKAATMVRCLLGCIHARSSILSASIIQIVQILLGYGLIALVAVLGAMSTLSILQLCAYQLFWFAAIFVVQKVQSI